MFRTHARRSHANHKQSTRVEHQRQKRDQKREQRRLEAARRQRLRAAPARPVEITLADTAADRYQERLAAFRAAFGSLGEWVHLAAWLAHNCLAHPLLGLVPGPATVDLHDRTSDWLNLRRDPSRSPVPDVRARWAWVLHHCVAHPLIGLAPRARWFEFHDSTAAHLGVEGWL